MTFPTRYVGQVVAGMSGGLYVAFRNARGEWTGLTVAPGGIYKLPLLLR